MITHLQNGLIVDGTGEKPYYGNVSIKNEKIEKISTGTLNSGTDDKVIDCTGLIVSPGWIDSHSHMDWFMANPDPRFHLPFTAQGITTFVGGMCGYGAAGYKKKTSFKNEINNNLFHGGATGEFRESLDEYFNALESKGIYHNIVSFIGHGTSRASIRGFKPGDLNSDETRELLYIIEEAIEQGARGVSFGLTYEPGIFVSNDEIRLIANTLKKKNKMMTVHGRAYSALAPTYPPNPFGKAHNIRALEEMLNIGRDTGVKMNYSHLIFAGERTWKTVDKALSLLENAANKGLDVMTEIFAQTGGPTQVNALFPDWFLAKTPVSYYNKADIRRLKIEFRIILLLLKFDYSNVNLTYGDHPDLNQYNGMNVEEIASEKKQDPFFTLLEISEKSQGRARIFNTNYLDENIIRKMLPHPQVLYMTDSWFEPEGLQNMCLYGGFPRIMEKVRDHNLLSKEEVVRKMTGAAADRYSIPLRGYLKNRYQADITVFNWENIKDNSDVRTPDLPPSGIEHVFINGKHVNNKGKLKSEIKAGQVIR